MRLDKYYLRWQDMRGGLGGLPNFARAIVLILAIPAVALLALSILLLGVSILALLLLPWPAYRLLKSVFCDPNMQAVETGNGIFDGLIMDDDPLARPRRHVEARIID
ncbi:MAG: hypothetical protein M3O30_05400 [Planctomycetota bacterium]|nr:hypothetical protein [Planctomycetota bacterium]